MTLPHFPFLCVDNLTSYYQVVPNPASPMMEGRKRKVPLLRGQGTDMNLEEHYNPTLFWVQEMYSNCCQVHRTVKIQEIISLPY